jgi:AcrR family transcriptional regulator
MLQGEAEELDFARQPIELTREQLYERMWSMPRVLVADELGMSSNGLAKICDRLMIPYPAWGFWTKQRAGKPQEVRPLGPAPEGAPDKVFISPDAAPRSRRPRSRLARADRMNQVLDMAAGIVIAEGASALSLKEVARRTGISEALVYAYWGDRAQMFAALARRELETLARNSEAEAASPASSYEERIQVTTLASLRLAADRGGLLQTLLYDPAVRDLIRRDYRQLRGGITRERALDASEAHGIPMSLAMAHIQLGFAASLRLGKHLAARQLDLETALRLALAVHLGGLEGRREGYRKSAAPSLGRAAFRTPDGRPVRRWR